jgi:hypothetical protein
MKIEDLKTATEAWNNIALLEKKKEELLGMKAAVNGYKDLDAVYLCHRSYMGPQKVVEFPKLDLPHMSYNLYMRDNFCPGIGEFIDKQILVLDDIIGELKNKIEKL